MSSRSVLAAAVPALFFAWATPGFAAPEDEAEVFVKKGIGLRKQGKDFEALAEFQRAFEIAQTPRTTGQLGLVEFALSRWLPAEEHMEAALQAAKDPWIVKNRAVLTHSLETIRAHIGQIELEGEPAGAAVYVNGKSRGKLPLGRPIRVGEGSAEVELKADGYRSERLRVTIRGELTEQLFMKLDRVTPAVTQTGPDLARPAIAVTGDAPAAGKGGEVDLKDQAASDSKPWRTMQVASYALAGVGVAAIATGGILTVKVRSLQSGIEKDAQPGAFADSRDLMERIDRGNRLEAWQWVSYGVGAVALVGGVTLWLLDRRAASREEPSVAFLPVFSRDGAGGSMAVRF